MRVAEERRLARWININLQYKYVDLRYCSELLYNPDSKALSEHTIDLHVRCTSYSNAAVEMAVREWLGSQQQDGKFKLSNCAKRVDVLWGYGTR